MKYRQTYADINLSAIRHNIREHQKRIPDSAHIMAIVKADGYGHGAVPVLEAALKEQVTWAGIALVEEAIELRDAGIDLPILLLGGWHPEAMPSFLEHEITPSIYSMESAQQLNSFAQKQHKQISVHLKVDTGMGRLGFSKEQLNQFLIHDFDSLVVDGVYTHFSDADAKDLSFTLLQLKRFDQALEQIRVKHKPSWVHTSNSAGASQLSEERGNLFRLGIAMYGQPPSKDLADPLDLREVVTWKTSIAHIQLHPPGTPISYGRTYYTAKESLIATLCVGYADGYPRLLSNKGYVLVHGKRVPIVGRVCMDMIMIDISDISDVVLFDEVVLIGHQGNEYISATEIAEWTGTINYEITCNISKRVARSYVRASDNNLSLMR